MKLLEFIFQSGWHFVGTVVLIYITGDSVAAVVRAAANRSSTKKAPE